jgi:hypothetical protein
VRGPRELVVQRDLRGVAEDEGTGDEADPEHDGERRGDQPQLVRA